MTFYVARVLDPLVDGAEGQMFRVRILASYSNADIAHDAVQGRRRRGEVDLVVVTDSVVRPERFTPRTIRVAKVNPVVPGGARYSFWS